MCVALTRDIYLVDAGSNLYQYNYYRDPVFFRSFRQLLREIAGQVLSESNRRPLSRYSFISKHGHSP
jgi:hypothetical protein